MDSLMGESTQLWAEAVRTLEGERPFALATVINVRGSTPREVGAKMLVRDDGQVGTIGGGCGEAEVFRKARLLLGGGGEARLVEVDLTGDLDQTEIGTCGGLMDVFIDRWTPARDLTLAYRLADAADHNRQGALLTMIDGGSKPAPPGGIRGYLDPSADAVMENPAGVDAVALAQFKQRARDGRAVLLQVGADGSAQPCARLEPSGAKRFFLDPIVGAQRLIIAGAGHIAQPLAELGAMLAFHVTVIDDRASFANRQRFPTADEIIVKAFGAAIDSLKLDRHCYLISVTRGHAFDDETVRAALKQAGCFIGMIGSRRRVKATLARIEEEGTDPRRLDEIHAPLGLDIGADTPAEIAVSIMAEIIRERRLGRRDEVTLGVKSGRLRRLD
jgi:xanthine dehydrogenase accessory factor